MTNLFNSLIIGNGEIGKSLHKVIGGDIRDTEGEMGDYDIIHICFPYSDKFENEVKSYQILYSPKYTLIHSTVPVGTSRKLKAIHSPVIGRHPYLEESIRTFTKFIGGGNQEVIDYFRRCGMRVYPFDKPETTELMKILDTTFYGVCIEYTKEVKRQCDKFGVPFEAWTLYTNNYNEGYQKLGCPEFTRPNLSPVMGKIGGHCVVNNCNFLDNKFTNLIKENNED